MLAMARISRTPKIKKAWNIFILEIGHTNEIDFHCQHNELNMGEVKYITL